jgi:hypothetical protein
MLCSRLEEAVKGAIRSLRVGGLPLLAGVGLLCALARAAERTRPVEIDSPAGSGSATPHLTAGNKALYLSWVESSRDGQNSLRFSRWTGGWSAPRTIVTSNSPLGDWADFPSLLVLDDGSLVAHWLQKTGRGAHQYDALVARSQDEGRSWSRARRPHRDGTLSQHGFVSLVDRGGGRFGVVWLDGRQSAHEPGKEPFPQEEILLMFAASADDGGFEPELILDSLVCECCQTAAASVGRDIFVAYRDRSTREVRDIAYLRFADGAWSAPRVLHPDDWQIAACPVNGPAVSADGVRLAVAWFSAPDQKSRVQVIFSQDGGKGFGTPVRVDEGNPAGRVDVEWMARGGALVTWLELTGEKAEIRARRVWPDGRSEPSFIVAPSVGARSSGFPRLARCSDDVFFAWTDPGPPSRVRVAHLKEP